MYLTKEGKEWRGTLFGADCEREAEEIIKSWDYGFRPNKPLPLEEIKKINRATLDTADLFEYLNNAKISKIAFPIRPIMYDTNWGEGYETIAFYTSIWIVLTYAQDDPYYGRYSDGVCLKNELDTKFWKIYDIPSDCVKNMSKSGDVNYMDVFHKGKILLRLADWSRADTDPIKINNIHR